MKITKFGHVVRVAYVLATVFAIVGGIVKPGELPIAILFVVVLMWTTTQIVREGASSLWDLIHGEDKTDK